MRAAAVSRERRTRAETSGWSRALSVQATPEAADRSVAESKPDWADCRPWRRQGRWREQELRSLPPTSLPSRWFSGPSIVNAIFILATGVPAWQKCNTYTFRPNDGTALLQLCFSEKDKMVLTGFLKFYVYCTTIFKYTKTT